MIRKEVAAAIEQQRATFLQAPVEPVAFRELQLEAQPRIAKELGPRARPGIDLRRAADGVVPIPAEFLSGLTMLAREPLTKTTLRGTGCASREIDPLQREISVPIDAAHREHAGNAHCLGAGQLLEPRRFRL